MKLHGLALEINRTCNLNCSHCMYGRDRLDGSTMSLETLGKIFSVFGEIRFLGLIGGEPFLSPDILTAIHEHIKQKHVRVHELTMITNGTILSEQIADTLNQIGNTLHEQNKGWKITDCPLSGCFYDEHEPIVYVRISDDPFHDNDPDAALTFYQERANSHVRYEIRTEHYATRTMKNADEKTGYITNTGNAETLEDKSYIKLPMRGNHRIQLSYDGSCPYYDICDTINVTYNGLITINADGPVYENPENIVCSIEDDIPDAVKAWNEKHLYLPDEAQWKVILDGVRNTNYLMPAWKWKFVYMDFYNCLDKHVSWRKQFIESNDKFAWHTADDLNDTERVMLSSCNLFDDGITMNKVLGSETI